MKLLAQFYLIATGNYISDSSGAGNPEEEIRALQKADRMTSSSFGFLSEIDADERYSLVTLAVKDLEDCPVHVLQQFCFAHGSRVGHNTSRDELIKIGRWIIVNEQDGVKFKSMPLMMQQAIDLAVLGQNAEKCEAGAKRQERLRKIVDEIKDDGRLISEDVAYSRANSAHLGRVASEVAQERYVADFQTKVMHAVNRAKTSKPPEEGE
jgi:hypothetical protein